MSETVHCIRAIELSNFLVTLIILFRSTPNVVTLYKPIVLGQAELNLQQWKTLINIVHTAGKLID